MFFKTLPASAQGIFARLGHDPFIRAFYLAGGSAAALQLGHRVSADLDLFTPNVYDPVALLSRLERLGQVTVQQQGEGTWVGLLAGTRISFFHYGYPLMHPPDTYRGLRIASLLDIALMKITAISQRGRRRDFVDLYFICKNQEFELGDLLKQIPEKYGSLSYPSYHLLRSLAYFDDAERDPPLKMLTRCNWNRIKVFFEKQVRELMGASIPGGPRA
ncbi:MAG: hypothetical protein A2V86_15365 [Deltaproteobacteria bacterium RBG_16_49_23]|nr:MAG: hypothetical protein A2V86_15365 [Deltaproteobacteria bacterium RBG_16_49_23]